MARKRNPRVVMREKMMEAKRWLNYMTMTWQSTSWTYDQVALPDGRINHQRRPIREDERAENSVEELRRIITYMRAAQVRCQEVEAIARDRLRELGDVE